jgi:hypothetical protein
MNSKEYGKICSKPNVLPKLVLEQTLSALTKQSAPEAKVIEKILSEPPIPFPKEYHAQVNQYYFEVNCNEKESEAITDVLFDLEACSIPLSGIGTDQTRQYANLVNIWNTLTQYIEENT